MAERSESRLVSNAVVRTINQDEQGVRVIYEGGEVAGRRAVVAIPPTLAGRLRYIPALPSLRDGLTQQIPAGSVIKFQIGFETPFWRQRGLSGLILSLDDALSGVIDNSPPDASCGVLAGFIEGAHAGTASQLTAAGRRDLIVNTLVKFLGPEAGQPFDVLEMDWSAEEFTRGCYGGRLGAGVWTQYGRALAEPVGRIPLGRIRDVGRVERVYGWSSALWAPGRCRGPRRASNDIRPNVVEQGHWDGTESEPPLRYLWFGWSTYVP